MKRRALLAAWLAVAAAPAGAQGKGDSLDLKVVELARTVDLGRGGEKFLTVTVEVAGGDPLRLRRVQPLREDFTLLAGKTSLPCRWLRGGSLPEDASRLRFVLGFSPPAGGGRVTLRANLPRIQSEDTLEMRLTDLDGKAQERSGPGWRVNVTRFAPEDYRPPALPEKGQFFSKAGPVDARVFRREAPGQTPDRVLALHFDAHDTGLFDPLLDVAGSLLVDGGPGTPMVSAALQRDPSRTVARPPYSPFVRAQFYFALPPKARATGAVIRLIRRTGNPTAPPIEIKNLPLPD